MHRAVAVATQHPLADRIDHEIVGRKRLVRAEVRRREGGHAKEVGAQDVLQRDITL